MCHPPPRERKRESACMRECVYVFMYVCVCSCTPVCDHVRVHTHVYTHTLSLSLSSEGEGERGEQRTPSKCPHFSKTAINSFLS